MLFLTQKIDILKNRVQIQQLPELDSRNKKPVLNRETIRPWIIFKNIRHGLNSLRKKSTNLFYQSTDFEITIYCWYWKNNQGSIQYTYYFISKLKYLENIWQKIKQKILYNFWNHQQDILYYLFKKKTANSDCTWTTKN